MKSDPGIDTITPCRKGEIVLNTIRALGGQKQTQAGDTDRASTEGGTPSAPNHSLNLLVVAAFIGGAAIIVDGLLKSGEVYWPAVVILAVLTALSERFDWSLYGTSRVSVAFAPILAAVVLFGVSGLAVVVPIAIAASYFGSGRPRRRAAFNCGVLTMAGAGAALVFEAFGSAGEAGAWPRVIAVALVASLVYYGINTALVALAIALDSRASVRATWPEHFAWLWPHYLILGLLGVSIAGAYEALGVAGLGVFLLPPLAMRLSMKQYVDRTAEVIEQLRRVNDELHQRNDQLLDARAQAANDSLTGLRNHRAFQERIRDEIRGAETSDGTIGLIMLDVDSFKQLNDTLGHLEGDKILRNLAAAMVEVVPQRDAYRYGGDEFAVLLPAHDGRQTSAVAERLRSAVADRLGDEKATISVGVSAYPENASSAEELIYTADMAMYWAKSAGKNRVGHGGSLRQTHVADAVSSRRFDPDANLPEAVAALVAALAARDTTTSSHTERCCWYALQLAEEMGLTADAKSLVGTAALLHDIGKLAVPDEILMKAGRLDKKEWVTMRHHSVAALGILNRIPSVASVAPSILHHHEHFDGSGYPDRLAGEEIPVASRILLVVDAFDAMTTDRPYRKALPIETAILELEGNSGTQFDPAVVAAFMRVLQRVVKPETSELAAAR